MITGIDNAEVVEFVSKDDKDNPTVFLIGVISNKTKMKFLADADPVARISDILAAGLKGIKNLKSKGQSVDITVIDGSIIDLLPMDVLMEVTEKVLEFNDLSADEIKN